MQENQNNKIWIYSKVPFENSYENPIKFNSQQEMDNFFNNSPDVNLIYSNETLTQIEKTGNIIVEGKVEKYERASYMRFKNSGRIFYAFILDCEYNNEGSTTIIFEIDVFNTYQLELFNNKISGYVEQGTLKRYNSSGFNILPTTQSISTGNKRVLSATPVIPNLVDWLVIVYKPSVKISPDDKFQGSSGFPSTYKNFRYVVVPCSLKRGSTLAYMIGGELYPRIDLSYVAKRLTNDFDDDGTNTVNQVVTVFTSKYIGIDYEQKEGYIEIKLDDGYQIHNIMKSK